MHLKYFIEYYPSFYNNKIWFWMIELLRQDLIIYIENISVNIISLVKDIKYKGKKISIKI